MKKQFLPLDTTYNLLTILQNDIVIKGKVCCICKCQCGNITKPIPNIRILSNNTKSCGCLKKAQAIRIGHLNANKPGHRLGKRYAKSLIGEKFGYLTVLDLHGYTSCNHEIYKCQCQCGNIINIIKSHLVSNTTKSCGCLRKQHIRQVHKKKKICLGLDPNILLTPINILLRVKACELYKQIKIRDSFTCQLCGKTKTLLHTHHIEPFSLCKEKQEDKTNLITLCYLCHKKAHDNNFQTGLNKNIQQILTNKINETINV